MEEGGGGGNASQAMRNFLKGAGLDAKMSMSDSQRYP